MIDRSIIGFAVWTKKNRVHIDVEPNRIVTCLIEFPSVSNAENKFSLSPISIRSTRYSSVLSSSENEEKSISSSFLFSGFERIDPIDNRPGNQRKIIRKTFGIYHICISLRIHSLKVCSREYTRC